MSICATWIHSLPLARAAVEAQSPIRACCHGERLELQTADGRRFELAVVDDQRRPVLALAVQVDVERGQMWLLAGLGDDEEPVLLSTAFPPVEGAAFEEVALFDATTVGCGAVLDQRWVPGGVVLIREAAEQGVSVVGNEVQAWSLGGSLLWRVYGRQIDGIEGIEWIDRFADTASADSLTLVCTGEDARVAVLVGEWARPELAPTRWRRDLELEGAIAGQFPAPTSGNHLARIGSSEVWIYAATHTDEATERRSYHVARFRRGPTGVTLEAHASGPGFAFGLWRGPGDALWLGRGEERPDERWDRKLGTLDEALAFAPRFEPPQPERVHEVSLSWLAPG